jgi:hypothetical protein
MPNADFACMAASLIIEVDGPQHGRDDRRLYDQSRTSWLEQQGYRVLRFWNNEVAKNPAGVLDAVYAELYHSTGGQPLPLRHKRRRRNAPDHPTPARVARRPSPSRGG